MKKFYLFIIIFLLIFSTFLLIKYLPKNYTNIYTLNNVKVTEKYLKKSKQYLFILSYKKINYPLLISKKYTSKRNLISKIKLISDKNIVCLNAKINNNIYPLCSNNKILIDYRLLDSTFLKQYYNYKVTDITPTNYKKINIYNYNNNRFLIWNYKGLFNLEKNKNDEINILKNDNYDNLLAIQNQDYLVMPNYDSKYYFIKIYIYNFQKNQLYSIETDYEIPYESYYLGEKENIFYLIDKNNEIEYAINAKKKEIKIVSKNDIGTIYKNQWQNISMTKLVSKEYHFSNENNYKFSVINNKLYMIIDNKETLISNNNVKEIVSVLNDNVYYLVNDTLYQYNFKQGEIKLLKYSEWNFNYRNQIFVFN